MKPQSSVCKTLESKWCQPIVRPSPTRQCLLPFQFPIILSCLNKVHFLIYWFWNLAGGTAIVNYQDKRVFYGKYEGQYKNHTSPAVVNCITTWQGGGGGLNLYPDLHLEFQCDLQFPFLPLPVTDNLWVRWGWECSEWIALERTALTQGHPAVSCVRVGNHIGFSRLEPAAHNYSLNWCSVRWSMLGLEWPRFKFHTMKHTG